MDELKTNITKHENEKNEIDSYENNKKLELKEQSEKRNKNLREVYNSFISSVESGNRQFLKNAISGRISAFKTGFYEWINSEYSQVRAKQKIDSLEVAHRSWEQRNFE
jgi:hypothetical protein